MKRYIIAILSCALLWSCDEFLDESPEAFRTPDFFYQNENEVNQGVAGVYASNRALYASQLQLRFGDTRADHITIEITGDAGGIGEDQLNEYTMDAANGNIASYWSLNYSGISRANFVLKNIDGASFNDEATKDIRVGEMLFFRTWFHFNLTRMYGDIPYVTQAGENPDQILSEEFLTRDPQSEVYTNLLTDIDRAISLLPNPADISSDDVGRASKGAALMLKAKILMAQQQYSAAIAPLEQIRTLGYELLDNYGQVFTTKNHNESIFEIQFNPSFSQPANFFTNFVPRASGTDLLGTGNTPNSRGNQFVPTDDIINLYGDDDARKSYNISVYTDNTGNSFNWSSKYAIPFVNPGEQNINFQMFRYADALLMLAECYEETNTGNPVPILVQIRTRAGLDNPNLTPAELGNLEQTIENERSRELFLEGHRYFDLLRRGDLVPVMTAHGQEQINQGLTVTPGPYQNIRTLIAIPNGQVIQFGFDQNTGW